MNIICYLTKKLVLVCLHKQVSQNSATLNNVSSHFAVSHFAVNWVRVRDRDRVTVRVRDRVRG